MSEKPNYENIRTYLKQQATESTGRGVGRLDVVAAKAKVSEGELWDIVNNNAEISDEIAFAISLITEPMDDQWSLDPDDPLFLVVPNLTDAEIVERLQFAKSEGVLGVIANISGVKGGVKSLEQICAVGRTARLDPVTRSLLLNIMTEEEDDET